MNRKSFKVLVQQFGQDTWRSTPYRFATEPAARQYGVDVILRNGMKATFEVVPSEDEPTKSTSSTVWFYERLIAMGSD